MNDFCQTDQPESQEDPEPHSILYMEDDIVSARVVMNTLERAKFSVDWVPDGVQGLAKVAYHAYAVVLVDYYMPERDGLEVIRSMQDRNIRMPIVMLTGSGDELVAVEAMKLGASDYVVKDLEGGYLTLLPAILYRAIRRHRELEQKLQWNAERERLIQELQAALAEVKFLGGLLPICAACKKVRDDDGYWQQVDEYLYKHGGTLVSHAICPDCADRLYGQFLRDEDRP